MCTKYTHVHRNSYSFPSQMQSNHWTVSLRHKHYYSTTLCFGTVLFVHTYILCKFDYMGNNVILLGVPDQMVDAITLLRERAENDESNVLYSLVNDLSKVHESANV